jgi:hypothetical protein
MPSTFRPRSLFVALLLLLVAGPALAYTIYLKDGTRIVAKTKYVVRGAQAIITMPSGTQTSYPLEEIDVARTDEANKQDMGTAIVIEGGETREITDPAATPPPKASLQDLIRKQGAAVQEQRPPQQTQAPVGTERRPRVDRSGRAPLRDVALANEIKTFLGARGAAGDIYQGSTARRVRLVFETRSEGPVFKVLLASAAALVHARERFPDRLDAFEVSCEMPEEEGSAGRFTLTPELASALLSGKVDLTRFYVEHVEF